MDQGPVGPGAGLGGRLRVSRRGVGRACSAHTAWSGRPCDVRGMLIRSSDHASRGTAAGERPAGHDGPWLGRARTRAPWTKGPWHRAGPAPVIAAQRQGGVNGRVEAPTLPGRDERPTYRACSPACSGGVSRGTAPASAADLTRPSVIGWCRNVGRVSLGPGCPAGPIHGANWTGAGTAGARARRTDAAWRGDWRVDEPSMLIDSLRNVSRETAPGQQLTGRDDPSPVVSRHRSCGCRTEPPGPLHIGHCCTG